MNCGFKPGRALAVMKSSGKGPSKLATQAVQAVLSALAASTTACAASPEPADPDLRLNEPGVLHLVAPAGQVPRFDRSQVVLVRCELPRAPAAGTDKACVEYFDSGRPLDHQVQRSQTPATPADAPPGFRLARRLQLRDGASLDLWFYRPAPRAGRVAPVRMEYSQDYMLHGWHLSLGAMGDVTDMPCCRTHFSGPAAVPGGTRWSKVYLTLGKRPARFGGASSGVPLLELPEPVLEADSLYYWPGADVGYVSWVERDAQGIVGHSETLATVDLRSGALLTRSPLVAVLDWGAAVALMRSVGSAIVPRAALSSNARAPDLIELDPNGPPLPDGLDIGLLNKFNEDLAFLGDYRIAYEWARRFKDDLLARVPLKR